MAFQGDLSGATGEIGRAQLDGARLAFERVNADDDRPLRLTLRAYDDKGEPDRTLDRQRYTRRGATCTRLLPGR